MCQSNVTPPELTEYTLTEVPQQIPWVGIYRRPTGSRRRTDPYSLDFPALNYWSRLPFVPETVASGDVQVVTLQCPVVRHSETLPRQPPVPLPGSGVEFPTVQVSITTFHGGGSGFQGRFSKHHSSLRVV